MLESTFEILAYVADIILNLWPLCLASALVTPKVKNRLGYVLAIWVLLVILLILRSFAAKPIGTWFIPEPLNTALFVLTGVGLFALYFLLKLRHERLFVRKIGGVGMVEDMLALSPAEFEDMIVRMYSSAGHQVKRTGSSGDHGVDVVVNAKNGEKWVVQCKRWRAKVGEPIVRDFYGTVQHEKAHRGILITTGKFTRPALAWAKGKPLALYDGEYILRSSKRVQRQAMQEQKRRKTSTSPAENAGQ